MKRPLNILLIAALIGAIVWSLARERRASEAADRDAPERNFQFVDIGAPAVTETAGAEREGSAEGLRAGPGSVVVGRCVGLRGEPLGDVQVSCAFPPAIATTGADGRFELALASVNSDPIHATLRAHRAGLGVLWTSADVPGGERVTLADWRLAPAVVLRGRVTDAEGAPLAGIEVRCTSSQFVCDGACYTPRGAALCMAATDSRGAFEILDAPAGDLCVWAGAEGRTLWVSSEPFRAAPAETIAELHLVATRVARENLLGVRVLDPTGRPTPGARIHYRFHNRTTGGSGVGTADESGAWVIDVAARTPHHVLAIDPDGRWRPTMLHGVQPGVLDAPLELAPAKPIALRALDPEGAPVETFALRIEEATDEQLAPGVAVDPIVIFDFEERAHPAGLVRINAPTIPFLVRVQARGCAPFVAGPFDADADDREIQLTLQPYPGVTGVVQFEGAPLADAKVTLHASANDATQARYGETLAESRTAADGSFRIAWETNGSYWLRASAAKAADGELGPFEFDARAGAGGAVLELTRGGAIEGVAHPSRGQAAQGTTIYASRGDGRVVMATTDADGAFRFTRLTPGPWLVERRASGASNLAVEGADAPAAVLCTVEVGAVAHVELVAPDAHSSQLRGVLAFDGVPASGWRITAGAKSVDVDASGSFELVGLPAGAARIACSPVDDPARIQFEGELILREGANELALDFPTGRIQGRARAADAADRTLQWSWAGDGLWIARGSTQLNAEGAFVILQAPAGRITLSMGAPASAASSDGTAAIQLDATTTVDVEL